MSSKLNFAHMKSISGQILQFTEKMPQQQLQHHIVGHDFPYSIFIYFFTRERFMMKSKHLNANAVHFKISGVGGKLNTI